MVSCLQNIDRDINKPKFWGRERYTADDMQYIKDEFKHQELINTDKYSFL